MIPVETVWGFLTFSIQFVTIFFFSAKLRWNTVGSKLSKGDFYICDVFATKSFFSLLVVTPPP